MVMVGDDGDTAYDNAGQRHAMRVYWEGRQWQEG